MDPIVLAGLVKRVYGNFNMSTFQNRLILQKFVFLMRHFKIDLGYDFSLYLRGPYSPDLARDAFQVESWANVSKVQFEDSKSEEQFNKCVLFIEKKKTDTNWLEIQSTLSLIKQSHKNLSDEQVVDECKKIKTSFDKEYIKERLNELNGVEI
jgi:uncharacterized protein YwgA